MASLWKVVRAHVHYSGPCGGGGGPGPPLFGQQLSLGPFFNVDKKLCCIFGAFTV